MLRRKALDQLHAWKENKTKQAVLVTGARQVGKTYIIREFARTHYDHFIEINLIENREAKEAFARAQTKEDMLLSLSAFGGSQLVKNKTLVFIDEVQESKEIVTAIKFLVEDGDYDFVLSGSLLGVELNDIRSFPVGYLHTIKMYPLDFEEYCWTQEVGEDALEAMRTSFVNKEPLPDFLHDRFLKLFHRYLLIGGMPDPVSNYVENHDIQTVRALQTDITTQYKQDATKYNSKEARAIKRIYDLIPAQLNQQNKRFVVSRVNGEARYSRYENDFLWLVDANVAIAAYNVAEPRHPLMLSVESSLFKLFLSDVGLLTCLLGMDSTREALSGNVNVNYGALYENVVAQELKAHGFEPYYFKNKRMGELDFVIENRQGEVFPIEVKSGKDYKRHNALTNVMTSPNYDINQAYVFYEGNVQTERNLMYCPAYMISCLEQ